MTSRYRVERYEAAVALAQLILQGDPTDDTRNIAQAFADVREEVLAGRRNQQEWPAVAARVLALIGRRQTDGRHLRAVE